MQGGPALKTPAERWASWMRSGRDGRYRPELEDRDLVGGGQDALCQEALAQEGVDDRGFAAVELPHHHHQEGLIQLLQRIPE